MSDPSSNNNGRKVWLERMAADPTLTVATRLVQVIVLPMAVWLFMQLWNGIDDVRRVLHGIDIRISVAERMTVEHQRRIDRLEALYYSQIERVPPP